MRLLNKDLAARRPLPVALAHCMALCPDVQRCTVLFNVFWHMPADAQLRCRAELARIHSNGGVALLH